VTSRGWRQLLNDIFRGRLPERNATAMERKWDPRLDDLGVHLEAPAQAEYRLVEASWVGSSEANDKRHIYVRVLDRDGTPLEGQPFASRTAVCGSNEPKARASTNTGATTDVRRRRLCGGHPGRHL